MSPVLKYKNETMKVDKIYVIEPSQGNAEKVDVKNMPMIADTFSNRRPFFTIFDHPIIQFDPMMATDKIIREEFGADFPNLRELVKNVSIMFFNSNPFLELTRPISNKIVNIGGLVEDKASDESKKLDNRTKRILDSAKEGAVLFSLGSITDTTKFNKNMINAIIDAFRKFPNIHFIWKVDKETINNKLNIFNSMPNVHLFEWIQQPAILAHPNLRAFITHCGQNSLYESARAGVPIIGIPLFGDQFYNAIVGETRGLGIQIDISDLYRNNAENLLIDALERILYEPIYRQNAKIISKKIKLTPFSPTERLVKWVEFAAEFGDLSELNLPGEKEMNWFVYYSIDVISFSIIVLIILVWIIIKSAKWLLLSINSIFLWSRKLGKLEKKLKKK
uniref:UDP-glucuronosyltransferase n=1 Tax=Meloidogyne hapla TaxID=6305 RepID=A0A1I8BK73_MELHA